MRFVPSCNVFDVIRSARPVVKVDEVENCRDTRRFIKMCAIASVLRGWKPMYYDAGQDGGSASNRS